MFASMLSGILRAPAGCEADELVELMAAHGRAEAMAAQRKVAAVAELHRRRCAADDRLGVVRSETGESSSPRLPWG